MIRYGITRADLRAKINAEDVAWFNDTQAVTAGLPANPASADFPSEWRRIKRVYIRLQCSKCCFCEKPLEGKIEQDVEHFRPKAQVKPWKVPASLAAQGITVNQPTDGSEPGYGMLAYHPFNYAMACKVCNSTLKRNFFPIEGARKSGGTDPTHMAGERPLLVYPLGSFDDDPESLIEFIGLSPVPKPATGAGRRRAQVTIEIFRLDDNRLRALFKARAYLLRLLYLELEGKANSATAFKRQDHQTAIDALTSEQTPFTNCMRSFKRLHGDDPAKAADIARECLKYMKSKSIPG